MVIAMASVSWRHDTHRTGVPRRTLPRPAIAANVSPGSAAAATCSSGMGAAMGSADRMFTCPTNSTPANITNPYAATGGRNSLEPSPIDAEMPW